MELRLDAALDENQETERPVEIMPMVADQAYPILPDMERIRSMFRPYAEAFERLQAEAKALAITTKEHEIHATDFLIQTQDLQKKLEKQRKDLVEKPGDWVKSINSLCKMWSEPLKVLELDIKRVMAAYMTQVRIEAQKKEREQQRALEEMQKAAEQKALEAELPAPAPPVVIPVTPQRSNAIARGTSGSASLRDHWDFEIVDISQVDRKYLMVNEKAVKADITAGLREAAGLRIFNDPKVVGRR